MPYTILAFFSRYNINMHYYLVSPTRIIRADASSFTYSSEERLPTGMIVAIEVGKINTIGVILQEVRQPDFEVKPISKITEEYPLPIELVQTAIWMSRYYATHQATVWQTILPSGLSKKRAQLTSPPQLIQQKIEQKMYSLMSKNQPSRPSKISIPEQHFYTA